MRYCVGRFGTMVGRGKVCPEVGSALLVALGFSVEGLREDLL